MAEEVGVQIESDYDDWDDVEGTWKEDVKPVLEKYAKKLGITIYVFASENGSLRPPRHFRKNLFINIFSGPNLGIFSGWQTQDWSGEAFGVDMGEDFYYPSPVSIKILNRKEVAAEVVAGTLYIPFDLFESDDPKGLIEKIMSRYAKIAPLTLTERCAIVDKNIAESRKNQWENFLDIFRIKEKKGILERNETQIRERYNELKKTAGHRDMVILPGEIRVRTERLANKWRDIKDIGDFVIAISTKPGDDYTDIKLIRLDPDAGELSYWYGDNHFCWGNVDSDGLDKYIDKREFALLVEMLIIFLQEG